MEEIIKGGALDKIDERNYSYSEIAWNVEIKDFVCLDDWIIQNQYRDWYMNWCVYFASSMNDNYCNWRDKMDERSSGSDLCDKSETRDPNIWDYLINWPKLLKKLWYIEWYFQLSQTIEEMKKVLCEWKPIHTWSNKISWSKIMENNNIIVWCEWTATWHAFHIIGYNATWNDKIDALHHIPNNCFICKDSSNSFDKWFFYLKFEDLNLLYFTKLVFENKLEPILLYKKKIMEDIKIESAKLFVERGYTNWERPQEPITREECWAIFERVLQKNNLQ